MKPSRGGSAALLLALACGLAGCSKKESEKVDPNAWPPEAVASFVDGCVEKARPGLDGRKVCTCVAEGLRKRWTWQEFRDFSEKGRDITRMSKQQLDDFQTVMTGCIEAPGDAPPG